MTLLLNEIEWGTPLFPAVPDPAWDAQAQSRGGNANNVDARLTSLPWLREFCFSSRMHFYSVATVPEPLFFRVAMVVAQENSCRYCYGLSRAVLKIQGHSDAFIDAVERDLRMAELDAKDQALLAFCRNLARSRPRPARAERQALIELGYDPLMVTELAGCVAGACFYNRVITMMACPPEEELEQASRGPLEVVKGIAAMFQQAIASVRQVNRKIVPLQAADLADGPFGPVLVTLAGLPAAAGLKAAMHGALAPSALTLATKLLIFAVVARALECRVTEAEAARLLRSEGVDAGEFERALSVLQSDRLEPRQTRLLSWARDTVGYRTPDMQKQTRLLAADIGHAAALEAIGTAALANCIVRLAMLLE